MFDDPAFWNEVKADESMLFPEVKKESWKERLIRIIFKQRYTFMSPIRYVAIWWKSRQEQPKYYMDARLRVDNWGRSIQTTYIYADKWRLILLDVVSVTMTDVNRGKRPPFIIIDDPMPEEKKDG